MPLAYITTHSTTTPETANAALSIPDTPPIITINDNLCCNCTDDWRCKAGRSEAQFWRRDGETSGTQAGRTSKVANPTPLVSRKFQQAA